MGTWDTLLQDSQEKMERVFKRLEQNLVKRRGAEVYLSVSHRVGVPTFSSTSVSVTLAGIEDDRK